MVDDDWAVAYSTGAESAWPNRSGSQVRAPTSSRSSAKLHTRTRSKTSAAARTDHGHQRVVQAELDLEDDNPHDNHAAEPAPPRQRGPRLGRRVPAEELQPLLRGVVIREGLRK